MFIGLSPNLPANVIEIGVEIAQARLDAINNGSSPTSGNPFTTVSYVTGLGYLTTSTAAATYAPLASPTFTGTPSLPTGTIGVTQTASDSSTKLATTAFVKNQSYLTTTSASSTYQTISGMTSYLTTATAASTYYLQSNPAGYITSSALSGYATETYVTTRGYIADAPSDGSEYVRLNGAWAVATGGGGGLTITTLSNGQTSTLDATVPTNGMSLTFDSTAGLKWATVGGGGGVAWGGITGTVTNQTDLVNYISSLGYITSVPTKAVSNVSSSPYTISLADCNNIIYLTGGGGMGYQITADNDTGTAYPDGSEITIVVDDTSGVYTITPTSGVTINTITTSYTLSGQYVWKLVKVAANTWYIA